MNDSCIILAAGNSLRMGKPKPFIRFNSHQSFFERILSVYQVAGIDKIIAVINSEVHGLLKISSNKSYGDFCLIENRHPERGRFYSIQLGLKEVGKQDFVFLQNIDNPFVNENIIQSLINNIGEADFAVPAYKGHQGHPVLMTTKIAQSILEIKKPGSNLRNLLSSFARRIVEVNDSGILANINTPEDYLQFFPDCEL